MSPPGKKIGLTTKLILEPLQDLVAARRQQQPVNEIRRPAAAAPVAEQYAIVLREWKGTRPEEVCHAYTCLGLRCHSELHSGSR